jgi:hypothetical protein
MTEEKFLGVGFVKFYVYFFVILFLMFFVMFPLYNWLLAPTLSVVFDNPKISNETNYLSLPDGFRFIEELKP